MKEIATVGIDLAKSVFSVHGIDANDCIILRMIRSGCIWNTSTITIVERCDGKHPTAMLTRAWTRLNNGGPSNRRMRRRDIDRCTRAEILGNGRA